VVGSADTQITDLTVNDHACLTFGEPEELLDLTAAFVRDGLIGGLKVIWLGGGTPAQAVSELARRRIAVEPAVANGQMTAAPWEGSLLSGRAFAAKHAMGWLTGQMTASLSDARLGELFAQPGPLLAGAAAAGDPVAVLPVLFGMLWRGELAADLEAGLLGAATLVCACRGGAAGRCGSADVRPAG